MEKPKSLSEFSLIEQTYITNRLDDLLENHKNEPYANFSYTLGYTSDKAKNHKNIYFYVPELKKFFFVSTEYLLFDLDFRYPSELVGDKIKEYNRNNIFAIDDLSDCRHGYYHSFNEKTIVYPEVINLFKEDNPYSAINQYKDEIRKLQNTRHGYGYMVNRYNFYNGNVEDLAYGIVYLKNPQLEKLVKSDFATVVYNWIHDPGNLQLYPRNFKDGNNINEITKLPKFAWQLLKSEGMDREISKWNEFRIWVQKDNLSKEQLETILNLKIGDMQTIKAIRSILNTKYNDKKLYTLDSLLNYLSRVDMYQAIRTEEAIILLKDYLRMALECNIEPITNSNSLKREHDVVMRNHQMLLKAKQEEYKESLGGAFIERSQELQKYEYKDNNLQVIVPKEMEDLLKEGRDNNNCVGSYIESFAKKRSNIFFIRKNENPEKSYITIEINSDFSNVRQAYYGSNREITNADDLNFIKKWINYTKEVYSKAINSLSVEKDIVDDMF